MISYYLAIPIIYYSGCHRSERSFRYYFWALMIASMSLAIGLDQNSFRNYPFGCNPSPFLDSLGISSYKAPRKTESKIKVMRSF